MPEPTRVHTHILDQERVKKKERQRGRTGIAVPAELIRLSGPAGDASP